MNNLIARQTVLFEKLSDKCEEFGTNQFFRRTEFSPFFPALFLRVKFGKVYFALQKLFIYHI